VRPPCRPGGLARRRRAGGEPPAPALSSYPEDAGEGEYSRVTGREKSRRGGEDAHTFYFPAERSCIAFYFTANGVRDATCPIITG
jgi:hypothetical protein